LFKDNELYNVDIIKNAEIIFYSRDDNDTLIGINKSKSGSINMQFDGPYKVITLLNQVDGEIYPESEFPENAKTFRGFDWRVEEKPNSVEDLFAEDPALNLPVIKGLEPYIEDEDFIDDALLNRVEKAGEKDNDAVNKAGRQLPKPSTTNQKLTRKFNKPLVKKGN